MTSLIGVERSGDFQASAEMWRAGFLIVFAFWALYYANAAAWGIMESGSTDDLNIVPRRLGAMALGLAATVIVHLTVSRLKASFWVRAAAAFLLGIVSWLIFGAANTLAFYVIAPLPTDMSLLTHYLAYLLQFSWLFASLIACYVLMMAIMDLKTERERTTLAIAQAHQAQLAMLRYQLNPHFLFNTLNAISSLVLDKRNDEAELMLLRLSRFLRHTIDADAMDKARLGDEVLIQREYLEIEQARFGQKLQITCAIPENLFDCRVPPLLLQPIVENAIKYAIAPKKGPSHLLIGAEIVEDRLRLFVEDDGEGFRPRPNGRRGLGIRNTMERLETLYGRRGTLAILERAPTGTRVELEFPLERGA